MVTEKCFLHYSQTVKELIRNQEIFLTFKTAFAVPEGGLFQFRIIVVFVV